jgi:hypothetical protein
MKRQDVALGVRRGAEPGLAGFMSRGSVRRRLAHQPLDRNRAGGPDVQVHQGDEFPVAQDQVPPGGGAAGEVRARRKAEGLPLPLDQDGLHPQHLPGRAFAGQVDPAEGAVAVVDDEAVARPRHQPAGTGRQAAAQDLEAPTTLAVVIHEPAGVIELCGRNAWFHDEDAIVLEARHPHGVELIVPVNGRPGGGQVHRPGAGGEPRGGAHRHDACARVASKTGHACSCWIGTVADPKSWFSPRVRGGQPTNGPDNPKVSFFINYFSLRVQVPPSRP